MPSFVPQLAASRREFLTSLASGGLGMLALRSLLAEDGSQSAAAP